MSAMLSEISEYEKARLQTIEANRAVLSALGLDTFKLSPTARKRSLSEAELAARTEAKQQRAAEAEKNRRQSTRLAVQATEGRKSTRELRALRDEQERLEAKADELMRRRRRAHNKARSGGPKSAPPLTEAERAALESASGEWIGGMRRYLAARVSDANLRSVMRVVERLASGQGVDSGGLRTRTPTFRKGQPVSMATDFAALRAEANVWLRPEDDPGHGWRLDHPIGKLALYQAHLAARSSLAVDKKTNVKSEAEGRAKRGAPAADAPPPKRAEKERRAPAPKARAPPGRDRCDPERMYVPAGFEPAACARGRDLPAGARLVCWADHAGETRWHEATVVSTLPAGRSARGFTHDVRLEGDGPKVRRGFVLKAEEEGVEWALVQPKRGCHSARKAS